MSLDFSEFFKAYESILAQADAAFAQVQKQFPQEVRCKVGCSDCCYALFDLPLVEALYLNHHFNNALSDRRKRLILEKANRADRDVYRLKRKAFKAHEKGMDTDKILEDLAVVRMRCPLLSEEDKCELYEYRPVTCRFYGIPTVIGDKSHTCGYSGFKQGEAYPTVYLNRVQTALFQISGELTKAIASKFESLHEVLVPFPWPC